jgi:hypothetical protein
MNSPGSRARTFLQCENGRGAQLTGSSSGFAYVPVSRRVKRLSEKRWAHRALSPMNVSSSSPPSIATALNKTKQEMSAVHYTNTKQD